MKQTATISFNNIPIEIKEQKTKVIISFEVPDESKIDFKIIE